MYRRCDRLRGELTLGSVIFQSVFFSLEGPSPVYLVSLVGLVYLVCLVHLVYSLSPVNPKTRQTKQTS